MTSRTTITPSDYRRRAAEERRTAAVLTDYARTAEGKGDNEAAALFRRLSQEAHKRASADTIIARRLDEYPASGKAC